MGDEVLKNLTLKLTIATLCLSVFVFAGNNAKYKQYDDLFNAINEKRYGLTVEEIDKTQNPFAIIDKKQDSNDSQASDEPTYKLKAIMNGSVNINGKWYKLNENIGEFKVKKINDTSVIIGNSGNSLELKLYEGNKNVIITTK